MESNQTKKLGIGIVGCGTIAGVHAEAIRQLPNAELVSVYSRNLENAQRLGEKFNATASNNWEEFIGNARLKVVTVCTPSGTHLDYGKGIAAAGKHVVVEKPIEVSLARGRQLIAVCRQNNVKLAVIFQNRFLPEVVRLKAALDAGELGKIFLAMLMSNGIAHRLITTARHGAERWRWTAAGC